jgi:hypothetical protein
MYQNTRTAIVVRLTVFEIIALYITFFFTSPSFMTLAVGQMPFQPVTITIVPGAASPDSPKYYDPQSISIKSGTTVKWINNDNSIHTVTFTTPNIFDSGIIPSGGSASHIFFDHGIFNYYCRIHPFMTGGITVF